MAKWPLMRGSATKTKRFNVITIKKMKLRLRDGGCGGRVVAVEVVWRGATKSGFGAVVPQFGEKSAAAAAAMSRNISGERLIARNEEREEENVVIEWDDEFENFCGFSKEGDVSSSSFFSPWLVSFHLLLSGEGGERSKGKLARIGTGCLNLGELASKMKPLIETQVPISIQTVDGVPKEASLSMTVSFAELRDSHSRANSSHELLDLVPELGVSSNGGSFPRRVKSLVFGEGKKMKKSKEEDESMRGYSSSSSSSDESASSSDLESILGYVIVTNDQNTESNTLRELRSSVGSETQLIMFKKPGFWKWKRRRSIPKPHKEKTEKLSAKKTGASPGFLQNTEVCEAMNEQETSCSFGSWETKELISRDGKTMLTSDVFFASFDQRSEKAAGASACTSIVAVMAHWLQSNQDTLPTRAEFDSLIQEGSSAWRKLWEDEAHRNDFPDGHFDLETVLQAELRPLSVSQERSFVSFFSPEKFEYLKEAQSFDKIWDEIKDNADDFESAVYIVSWNDHFFILKVEADAYYIIDSLGERLHEGCDKAYILRFDDSSFMCAKTDGEENEEEIICGGKECCREYIKRFLAAIHVEELQEAEENGTVSILVLCRRLQVEFHFAAGAQSSACSSTSSLAASPVSPFFLDTFRHRVSHLI